MMNLNTKKAIVELCAPFRDKYNLTDEQTLCIARDELSKQELLDILESKGEWLKYEKC